MARLQQYYKETVVPELIKQFGYKSVMQVPRITKITLNMGVGEAVGDKKVLEMRLAIWPRSPVKSRLRLALVSRLPVSRFVTGIRSVAWSRCAVRACSSFWIA